jgi:hypothetical protein
VNASGHPFWIQTVSGAYSSGNVYSGGVTNGGAAVGTIIWEVPFDAPDNLYYACQYHSSMAGSITVSDLGPTGVVAATSPVTYDAGTRTVGIDLSAYDTSSEVDTKVADSKLASFITDATTARTLTSAADEGKTIQFTSGSATVLTVNASSDFTVGARVDIIADGAGALTVTASGATIKAAEVSTTSGSFTIGAQYSAATLLCVATDEYRLIGNITAV